jgi:subtilisin family serine protease
MLGLNCLHSAGYRGQGARVAFFDSGFPQMDQHTVFDSLFGDNRVLGTWDFYTHAPIDYTTGDAHGTWCSSIAIANLDGVLVGASPKASVYLLRTENVTYERNIEEYNWLAGAEWADSAGAQIISSSLSYNTFDTGETSYVFAQMDGQSTVCAQAAQFATARGILVVSSAGNEGGGPWGRIATPCDADSSLCVGAVNASGAYVNFSSRGPSADGRVKPDVTAQGFQTAYYNTSASIPATGNGTSFSCPLISGLAACLLSKHPTATAWQLRQAIVQSADRLANPDSLYGYGIPNACRADSLLALVTARPEGQPRECPELRATHRPLSGAWDLVLFSPQAHTYQLEVVDLTGRTVLREAGLHSNVRYPVSTDGLASGVYVLRATWPQAFCQVKLLLVR